MSSCGGRSLLIVAMILVAAIGVYFVLGRNGAASPGAVTDATAAQNADKNPDPKDIAREVLEIAHVCAEALAEDWHNHGFPHTTAPTPHLASVIDLPAPGPQGAGGGRRRGRRG